MQVNQKILDAFDHAHKKRSAVKHPLCSADTRLRIIFVHAAALVACVDAEICEREELERLAYLLDLEQEVVDQAIGAAESAESDLVESIVDAVTELSDQKLLILDLYRIALADGTIRPEEKKVVELTCKLLKLSKTNIDFLRKLAQLIASHDAKAIHELLNSAAGSKFGISPDAFPYLLQDIPDWQKVVKLKAKVNPKLETNKRNANKDTLQEANLSSSHQADKNTARIDSIKCNTEVNQNTIIAKKCMRKAQKEIDAFLENYGINTSRYCNAIEFKGSTWAAAVSALNISLKKAPVCTDCYERNATWDDPGWRCCSCQSKNVTTYPTIIWEIINSNSPDKF